MVSRGVPFVFRVGYLKSHGSAFLPIRNLPNLIIQASGASFNSNTWSKIIPLDRMIILRFYLIATRMKWKHLLDIRCLPTSYVTHNWSQHWAWQLARWLPVKISSWSLASKICGYLLYVRNSKRNHTRQFQNFFTDALEWHSPFLHPVWMLALFQSFWRWIRRKRMKLARKEHLHQKPVLVLLNVLCKCSIFIAWHSIIKLLILWLDFSLSGNLILPRCPHCQIELMGRLWSSSKSSKIILSFFLDNTLLCC